ncbi:MAG TPA: branched-chain amino acid ABC transporter permease [Anaeromyxobacteraceae bacterium]|nr:branched-chain amino acid ABC transporter permease [Anaeromyxobacteraceae bacterium]
MRRRRLGLGLLALAGALAFPLLARRVTWQNTAILMLMTSQLGVAWNLLGGYAGQVSLGHAAFFGTGAYVSTLLSLKLGVSPWLGMLAGGAAAASLGALVGWPCFRLKGHYFAMATIAVGEIVQAVVNGSDALGGAVGFNLPLREAGLWGFVFNRSKLPYYYIALGLLLATVLVNALVNRSHVGYYLRAIKDEPDAARSLGVSLGRYKTIAMLLSAALTAMGGTLYAQKELFIDPGSTLSTSLSIKIALVAILGGAGTLWGPVLGAVLLTGIEEASRIAFGGTGRGTDLVVYGLLLVLIAVFQPAGIMGFLRQRAGRSTPAAAPAGEAS